KAEQTAAALTDAQGDTKGKSVAIGVGLALTIGHHPVEASISRNVIAAGPVSVLAFGSSDTASDATASARGAPGDATSGAASGGVEKQVGDQRDLGNTKASQSGTQGGGSSTSGDGTQAKSDTSSGPIAIGAAIAINIAITRSRAWFADGIIVTTTGAVAVTSSANTDASAHSDGSAVSIPADQSGSSSGGTGSGGTGSVGTGGGTGGSTSG